MDKPIPAAFLADLEVVEEFFCRVQDLKEDTRENRIKIWQDLVTELRAISLTDQDLKQYIRNKKVLRVKESNNEQSA